jgi:hypothetical protein
MTILVLYAPELYGSQVRVQADIAEPVLVRLDCNHLFCISCLVFLQRKHHDACPICRRNVVLRADSCTLTLNEADLVKSEFGLFDDELIKVIFS